QVWNGSFTYLGSGGYGLNLGSGAVTLNSSPTVTVSAATLTVGGPISGGYGSGLLMLSGNNVYTGPTTVNGGTLEANMTASLPGYNASGMVTVNSGGTLAVKAGGTGEWQATD